MAVWIGDEIFSGHIHPRLHERPYPVVDGDDTDAGGRLGMVDVKKALPSMHVYFAEVQQLIDAHAGVDEHEHCIRAGRINVLPKPIDFLPAERMMRPHGLVFADLDQPVKGSQRVLHPECIFESQRQQRPDFFARAVGQPVFFHAVNHILQVPVFDAGDLHIVQARAV